MNKILAALALAINFVTGTRARETAKDEEIAKLKEQNAELIDKLATEDLDDTVRETALEEARKEKAASDERLKQFEADSTEAQTKADELVAKIKTPTTRFRSRWTRTGLRR